MESGFTVAVQLIASGAPSVNWVDLNFSVLVLGVGSQTLSVTFTPTYNTASLTINRAAASVTPAPALLNGSISRDGV